MKRSLLSLAPVLLALWSDGAVDVAGVHTDSDAAYGEAVSDSDLVNAGSPSLAAPPVYSSDPFFGPAANNDGSVGAAADTEDITFWLGAAAGDQFTITYRLDTSFSPLGFDLTSVQTIHGWTNASGNQKNQNYTVAVSTVGSEGFSDIATVAYLPFGAANNVASSKVTITENATGILATEVDEIRFTYTVPPSGGANPSPTIREIDVFGRPSMDGPDTSPPTPNPMTFAETPYATSSTSIAMRASPASDPSDLQYFFAETSGNPGASDSGWQTSPSFEDEGLTPGLEYTYTVTARDLSEARNTTAPSAPASATAGVSFPPPTITAPTGRQIVQRSARDLGTIPIKGTYLGGAPDVVEARMVVIPGGTNSGTNTDWQVIDESPENGSFAGTLNEVPAGGWYRLEVRSVNDGTPGEASLLDKIGVGDIYVTCGQSNAANFGSPPGVVTDDRVSAWNYTNGAWTKAADPMPGARGGGGSVWTRLGDLLAARENVPVAFACLAVGGTRVSQWVPPGGNYPRLSAAMNGFPMDGFRAILWHQGESDSLAFTSGSVYQSRLESAIARSRVEAGWPVPWFVAEASFHPNSNLSQEEPVVSGQRSTIYRDPLVFPGPVTDDFHLEGKLSDAVHFNGAGLADHAAQWAAILGGNPPLSPKNGDFEANAPLADGASAPVIPSSLSSPSVIAWRTLSPSGETTADGACGYLNPDESLYPGSDDRGTSNGVAPGMSGKHVAFLSESISGTQFLQTRRVMAEKNRTYTLTAALGVRRDPGNFGGARLEILANGEVVAQASFDKPALDALRGGDSSGTFTDASVSWSTASTVAPGQPLAIRIVKQGGAGTVIDFDHVRFTSPPARDFDSWIDRPEFGLDPTRQEFGDDPDLDGFPNGLEAWFGTNPGQFDQGLAVTPGIAPSLTLTHPRNNEPLVDITGYYEWSPNLIDWYDSGDGPDPGPVVTLISSPDLNSTTVTATIDDPATRVVFLRVGARPE